MISAGSARGSRHVRGSTVPASRDPTAELRLEDRDDGVPGATYDLDLEEGESCIIEDVVRVEWIQQGQHWTACQANSESEALFSGLCVASVCINSMVS